MARYRLVSEEDENKPRGRFRLVEVERQPDRLESFLSGAADSASFGFGDEALAATQATLGRRPGEEWGDAYARRVAESRTQQRRAQQANPWSYGAGQFAGAAIPGTAVAKGVGVGVRTGVNALGRLGIATAGGAASGAVYGAGSADGGNRLAEAGQGALWGAAFGGGLQAVGMGAGHFARSTGIADRFRATTQKGAREVAMERLGRVLEDAGETPASVRARLTQPNAGSRGELVAEELGEPGRETLGAIARAPGTTGQQVVDRITTRQRGQFDRVQTDLDALGASQSPRQVRKAIEDARETVGREAYQPVMASQPNAELVASRIRPIVEEEPVFQVAMRAAQRLASAEARRAGRSGGKVGPLEIVEDANGVLRLADNASPRTLHLIKLGLDDAVASAMKRMDDGGIGPNVARELTTLKREFLDELDAALPGYKQARAQWGGLAEADEALEMGQRVLNERADDVAEYVADLTPFQRDAFRAGVTDSVRRALSAADIEGRRNIVRGLLRRDRQDILRAAFNSEDEMNAFIDVLRREADLFESGSRLRPNTNSPTSNTLLRVEDLAIGATPGGMTNMLLRAIGRQGAEGLDRRVRNELGNVLASPVRDGSGRLNALAQGALADEIERGLLAKALARRTRTQQAIQAAAQGGGGGGAAQNAMMEDPYYY